MKQEEGRTGQTSTGVIDVFELQQDIDAGAGDKSGRNKAGERNQCVEHGGLLNVMLFFFITPSREGREIATCHPARLPEMFLLKRRAQVFLKSLRE